MKLSGLIQNIYQQIFIGIVIQHSSMKVCVQLRKGNKLEKEVSRHFEISHATPTAEANEFIKSYMDESPFSYIAVLNDTLTQGAIPTCSMHQAENFNDLGSCVTICNENKWMVYAEKTELNALQKRFLINGLDFIFSPFFIMSHFFADKIQDKTSLLVLIQDDYLSLCIFNDGELLFANHYTTKDAVADEKMSADIEESAADSLGFSLEDDDEMSINLDDIDALDELDSLDDLDNLQDLDDLDDLDEIEDFEESLNEAVEADACESGPDLIKFLEEELFVSAYKRSIDLDKELVKMAISEAEYAI